MTFLVDSFLSAISGAGLLAVILWLCRKWISERLTLSIRHEYDTKLSVLNNRLTADTESLKSALAFSKLQTESLQKGALDNLALREQLLFEKKVAATETIWRGKCHLAKYSGMSQISSIINWKEMRGDNVSKEKLMDLANTIAPNINLTELNKVKVQEVRPFVSKLIWAYYVAYQAVIYDAVTKLEMMKKTGDLNLLVENAFNDVIKKALPELSSYIDEHGEASYHYLLEPLSDKLLAEIQLHLSGKEEDGNAVKRASEILAAVQDFKDTKNVENKETH